MGLRSPSNTRLASDRLLTYHSCGQFPRIYSKSTDEREDLGGKRHYDITRVLRVMGNAGYRYMLDTQSSFLPSRVRGREKDKGRVQIRL
jgi:hypothetical protein